MITLRDVGGVSEREQRDKDAGSLTFRFSLHRRMCGWPSGLYFDYERRVKESGSVSYSLGLGSFKPEPEPPGGP